ncbi:3-deoxy-manno-octulosonate cytidylyltransferase [Blastopirellula sp. JC732]|uniref:3-deoxy-manno-octulosonate cytidylyltransferase n=1 Tax=Blastopirellula sediminis TaxID=2894196 RepID=A0A9X1SH65_9BACT|nr:3-deoxy-manno-octulosonate cytidylyltransferase [Blastopirellula sediminis]MCC9604419.1 3-deoxy-manno-octulosonate cytidylyltransferase [Blastopirellula sediminis]MCC9626939.1 3-deoxy-manno-octulosonate cytidylyltransferase [Blastopirellula sediminis]
MSPQAPLRLHLRTAVIIPARLQSTRLPHKMLLAETGKPLIQHTYEAAVDALRPEKVIVATDHPSIRDAVLAFGGEVLMTSESCASGTDRLAEAATQMPDFDLFLNVQGDEPEIASTSIDTLIKMMEENPGVNMGTLATPIRDKALLSDPACVKVVLDQNGKALLFSRSQIPFVREWDDAVLEANPPHFLMHLGIYAYRRDFLLRIAAAPRTEIEKLESLEQLRVLSMGESIHVGIVNEASSGIDTPSDYAAFVSRKLAC